MSGKPSEGKSVFQSSQPGPMLLTSHSEEGEDITGFGNVVVMSNADKRFQCQPEYYGFEREMEEQKSRQLV